MTKIVQYTKMGVKVQRYAKRFKDTQRRKLKLQSRISAGTIMGPDARCRPLGFKDFTLANLETYGQMDLVQSSA